MRQRKMPGYDEIRRYKDDLIIIVKRHIPDAKIYLFDVQGFGCAYEKNLDIAIDAGHEIDDDLLTKIGKDIDKLGIPYVIDVLDLQAVYDTMRDHIMETGVLLSA